MPIKIRTVGSWKEAMDEFVAAKGHAVAVVPGTKWVDLIHTSIMQKEGKPLIGRRAYTIREWISERTPPLLPVMGKRFERTLIHDLLKKAKLSYFKNPSCNIAALFMDAIGRLKSNRIGPDALKKILGTRGGPREADLLKIYNIYEEELSKKGLFDEESLFLGYKKTAGEKDGPFVIGFDPVPPLAEELFSGGIFYSAEPSDDIRPETFVLNSPYHEAIFVAQKIESLLSAGTKAEKIGVYLNRGDAFAWELANKWSDTPAASLGTANLTRELFNITGLPERADPGEYSSAMLAELERRGGEIIRSAAGSFLDKPYLSSRSLSCLDALKELFAKLKNDHECMGERTAITKAEFFEMVHCEVDGAAMWPLETPFRLIPFEDAGREKPEHAFICCFNNGRFPMLRPEMFFTEPDTLAPLPDPRIGKIFPTPEDAIRRARRQFRMAAAADRVTVTYHAHTETGNEASPSLFLLKFPKTKNVEFDARRPAVPAEAFGAIVRSKEALNLLERIANERPFSATRLETFGVCPFVYFAEHILGIEPKEEKTPEVQPKDRGTLIHETLEDFFITNRIIWDNRKISNDEIYRLAARSVDKVFDSRGDITSCYHKEMVANLRERTKLLVAAIVLSEMDFLAKGTQRPSRFEMEFRGELEKGIELKGVIDRIDEDEKTFSVLDYKSGQISSVRNGINEGTELQMPLYTEMARRLLNKEPSAAFLYSTKRKKRESGIIRKIYRANVIGEKTVSRITIKEEEWDALIEKGIETAVNYVKRIRAGDFGGEPVECPSYCDFKDACRYGTY